MTKQEIQEWSLLQIQFNNGYHLSKGDWVELIRLNHLIMEASHNIHNNNMYEKELKREPETTCELCGKQYFIKYKECPECNQGYDKEWNDFVCKTMEDFANNPSNKNKYFSNLIQKIDERK